MSAPAVHHSYQGKLTENAHVRQAPCDKLGHMRPVVCLRVQVQPHLKPINVTRFCADTFAADAYAKTLRKGAIVTVHINVTELQLSGTADFVELQSPAPEATRPDKPANAQEPELQF